MPVSLKDVEHIAALARLGLGPEEAERLRGELDAILSYVRKLDALDTSGADATAHVIELSTPLREDRITNAERAEAMLSNAPDRDRDFLRVPKIIE